MPRLTSCSTSPWVATTRFSFTATITPQPVPQKRHGAFDHLSWAELGSVAMFCARPGSGMPATAAAVAAAVSLMNSLRVVDIGDHLVHRCQGVDAFIDQHRGKNSVGTLDARYLGDHFIGCARFERDDELALGGSGMDLRARDGCDRTGHDGRAPGRRMHHEAGDVKLFGHLRIPLATGP